jgi:hypothetical protein
MELNVESIKRREQIKFTDHARLEMEKDGINADDVLNAIENGKVIEEYRNDSPFPSCLLYGKSDKNPIHVVCALPQHVNMLIIVTVYIPDPMRWIELERRRK